MVPGLVVAPVDRPKGHEPTRDCGRHATAAGGGVAPRPSPAELEPRVGDEVAVGDADDTGILASPAIVVVKAVVWAIKERGLATEALEVVEQDVALAHSVERPDPSRAPAEPEPAANDHGVAVVEIVVADRVLLDLEQGRPVVNRDPNLDPAVAKGGGVGGARLERVAPGRGVGRVGVEADHSGVLTVPAVVAVEPEVAAARTREQIGLVPGAQHVVQSNRPGALAKRRGPLGGVRSDAAEAELAADDPGVIDSPVVVAHGAPGPVGVDLNPPAVHSAVPRGEHVAPCQPHCAVGKGVAVGRHGDGGNLAAVLPL